MSGPVVVGDVEHLEADRDGRIVDIAVAPQADLEIGQGGSCRPRIGEDLEGSVDQTLVPEGAEYPPHALHELRVHGLVVVGEIDPTPDPPGDVLPLRGGDLDHPAARLVELRHAERSYLTRTGDAEALFHLHLDREAVGVPPEPPFDAVTPHGPIARDYVLYDPGKDVPVVGAAGGEGWAVVEAVFPVKGTHLDGPAESVGLVPLLQHAGIEGRKIEPGRNPAEIGAWLGIRIGSGHRSSGSSRQGS